MEPSKAVLNALERVFDCEIHGRLPFQSRAKIYKKLEEDGLVARMTRTFGNGLLDRFAVTVEGYELTHLGRLTYCMSCEGSKE